MATKLFFLQLFFKNLKCTIILITYLSTASPLEKTASLLNIGTQSGIRKERRRLQKIVMQIPMIGKLVHSLH